MLYLAIDQHHKQLTVNLRDENGDVLLRRQVSTQWEKVRKFFTELKEMAEKHDGFVAILEVCGFNDWLLKMLREYGCRDTLLIQPTTQQNLKTDFRDANALGELLWTNRSRLLSGKPVQNLRRVHPPQPIDAENRQLTELHKRLIDTRTRTINRVHHLLHKHNLSQEQPCKGIQTKTTRKWLKTIPLNTIDRLEMDQLLKTWELLDEQLATVKAQIEERQPQQESAVLLRSIPGVSAYSSLALACRLSDSIERFPTAASLANYWGLTPGCRNSGDATQRLGSITKAGSPPARGILGQLLLHLLRKDKWLKQWYQRIKQRRGAKIARVAVMRRLATIIWHMLKRKVPYVDGGPQRVQAAQAALAALAG